MSLRNFRIFTVLLLLELVVFEAQVEAFTIQRTADHADLAAAETTHLEVRNDLKSLVKPIEGLSLTEPIYNTIKTEEVQNNVTLINKPIVDKQKSNEKIVVPLTVKSTQDSEYSKASTEVTLLFSNVSSTIVPTEKHNTLPTVTKSTKQQMDDSLKNNSTKTIRENGTSAENNKVPANSTVSLNNTKGIYIIKNNNVTNLDNSTEFTEYNHINTTKLVNTTNSTNATNEQNTLRYVNETDDVNSNSSTTSKKYDLKELGLTTSESNGTSYSVDTVDLSIDDDKTIISTNKSAAKRLLSSSEGLHFNVTGPEKGTHDRGPKNTTEEPTGEHSKETAIPYWKKYTTIERKRLNSTNYIIPTTSTEDLLQSGTAQSQTSISLEKALNIESGIPSLEQLKNDLLEANKINSTAKSIDTATSFLFQGNDDISPNLEITTQTYNVVSSKRAGFLDFSLRPVTQNETNATETNAFNSSTINIIVNEKYTTETSILATLLEPAINGNNSVNKNSSSKPIDDEKNTTIIFDFSSKPVIENGSIITEKTVTKTEVPFSYTSLKPTTTTPQNLQNKYRMTSQNQMVEDAIKEELLKEAIIKDSVEYAQRQQEDRFQVQSAAIGNKSPRVTTDTVESKSPSVTSDTSSEEKLRVKPISFEKSRSGSLYTVNPNYKPLKKIEVQQSKPFVRNPDDNSWRNESLSSLGIVFKANNSPKPFTQVLKNKTELELNNNILEKYEKGDELELRTRLEKIAEMRKSKKKKINSLGETVYNDYEETTSGENAKVSNNERFPFNIDLKNYSSFFDVVDIEKLTTTPVHLFDVFRPTTVKPEMNINDYEEEDESDYTLPNIDLKKFITSTAAAPSVQPIITTNPQTFPPLKFSVRTNPPNRQPTLQYFPPREKQQKVIMNDYDTGFRNKINSFTFNNVQRIKTSPITMNKSEKQNRPINYIAKPPNQMDKTFYFTQPWSDPRDKALENQHDAAGYNQAADVINHLRDFINEVVKVDETAPADTESIQGVTANNMAPQKKPNTPNDYDDYEAQFRKDALNRFIENFNQNSDRFKADFPVLYNTSVIHSMPGMEDGRGAESTAFMKRLYDDIRTFQQPKSCDPNCERTVELSPAYELHYYVPEQEEKEEIDLKLKLPVPPPIRIHL